MQDTRKGKVFVGLSGGVDSAVSAAMLLKLGYAVTGVFIKTWHPDFLPCTEEEDRLEAARVAAHLDIPFLTLDLSREYKEGVADALIAGYRRGETPNPDVLCNKEVKFGAFLRFALGQGASFIATGHYVRKTEGREPHLLAGLDPEKDQSYFLWMLSQEEIARTLFPIGHLRKKEVRDLARRLRLPNAERKDSQGICFLGDVSMSEFLAAYIPLERGPVLDTTGAEIGEHDGAALYTVGQRHGFQIAHAPSVPHFVIATDVEHNTVTVTEDRAPRTGAVTIALRAWNSIGRAGEGIYAARFRYRQPLVGATLLNRSGTASVLLDRPAYVPKGQSLVLYSGDRLVAGGVVDAVTTVSSGL